MNNKLHIESVCVQADKYPNHSHILPIYPTSTYTFDTAEEGAAILQGKEKGYIYSRFENPTSDPVCEKIAALESFGLNMPLRAYLTSSGMGAISTVMMACVKQGEKVLTHYSLYGGTEEWMMRLMPNMGVQSIVIDFDDLNNVETVLKNDKTISLIYIETPANPTLQCVDIKAICDIAKKCSVRVCCDNTFATPILQQPFAHGVDFVIHSVTKYLNGHGTTIGGVVLGNDLEFMNTVYKKTYRLLGANSNPFDSWLVMNGLKTLPLRMERHCSNAMKVAEYLQTNNAIAKVDYLGITNHPYHQLAKKQMKDFGGMICFELKNGLSGGQKFINNLNLCVKAVSLGTVDTLVSHPASMTHTNVPQADRLKYGITDGLIRMSVGLEHADDIIADIENALK
jgi:methionine-gamma-lyase